MSANARLIAAAPDLYEALRYIVEQVDKGVDDSRAFAWLAREALIKASAPAVPNEEAVLAEAFASAWDPRNDPVFGQMWPSQTPNPQTGRQP